LSGGEAAIVEEISHRIGSAWAERTCGEGSFTQTIRVALATLRKRDDPAGNDFFHDPIGAPKTANVFNCFAASIRTSP
jgi:hypothetical protein